MLLLAGCLAAGTLTGLLVETLFAVDWGYLAIPALIALAWLFVADPSKCLDADNEAGHTGPDPGRQV